jgi:putative DNA primase/helicase
MDAQPLQEFAEQAQNRLDIKTYLEREQVGDAELFAELMKGRIAYDHAAHKWYLWRGNHWGADRNGEMRRLVINHLVPEYLRAAADAIQANNKELGKAFSDRAQALLRRRRIEDVLNLASSMEALALTGDEWECDPMALGVNNGVLDLTTGTHREGEPGDYMRVYAPTDWLGIDQGAPNFEKFISNTFGGHEELIAFMQSWLGLCLTGETTERRLLVFYGDGANGKSTLVEIMRYVLGDDLAHLTQADFLMDTKRNGAGPQPDVYALRGKRFVCASESSEGQRIRAAQVKQLTGNDSITTRTIYSDLVTFRPTFKTMLVTNHKPHISADDLAMWDRVLLIPFTLRFVDEPKAPGEYKRDPELLEKLKAEAPGILAWLVRGCLAWQREGLNPPASVIAATEDYRTEEDTLGEFIAECLYIGENAQAYAKDLYTRYNEWAKTYNLDAMSMTAFGKRMKKRYGEPARTNKGMQYSGVGVLA